VLYLKRNTDKGNVGTEGIFKAIWNTAAVWRCFENKH